MCLVLRRCAIGFALASLAMLSPRDADAAGAVIGKEGETVSVSTARVAVAIAPGRTALWAQVGVTGASAGFVWILPVRSGSRIDLGSDAWLDALDAATSPLVLPPSAATPNPCDVGLSPQRLLPTTSPHSGLPVATGLFTDLGALESFVTGAGFAIPAGLKSALGPVLAGGAVIASTYAATDRPVRTVRVVDSGPPLLPFALTGVPGVTTQATAFVIASAGAAAGSDPLTLDPASVTWAGDRRSTFVQARADLLDLWQGARWLTESAAPGLLFDGAAIGTSETLPAVLAQYFALAQAYGDTTADSNECATAALSGQFDSDPYVAACPVGTLGIVPGPSLCANDADGGVSTDRGAPIDALFCGSAVDDAALAVGGLAASGIWVSRIEGIVTQTSASDVPLSLTATPSSSPVVTASGYSSSCGGQAPPPSFTPPPAFVPPPFPTGTSQQPQQSSSSSTSSSDVGATAAEGCSGAADACASTASTDDQSDTSGDCSGDSSSTSSDDACNSDASSSNDCATGARTHRRRGRSPVSRVLMVLVAALAVLRRRKRANAQRLLASAHD
jgi:hypothetical protein